MRAGSSPVARTKSERKYGYDTCVPFLIKVTSQHLPTFEIGYHFESGLSKQGEAVLHYHEYSAPGVEYRGKAKPITPELYEKYKQYFKGV